MSDKDVVIVLKDERRDLLQDAQGLFKLEPPRVEVESSLVRKMWDVEGLTSWTAVDAPPPCCPLSGDADRRSATNQDTGDVGLGLDLGDNSAVPEGLDSESDRRWA